MGRQLGGLGDDPDAGLAALRAGDDAADVFSPIVIVAASFRDCARGEINIPTNNTAAATSTGSLFLIFMDPSQSVLAGPTSCRFYRSLEQKSTEQARPVPERLVSPHQSQRASRSTAPICGASTNVGSWPLLERDHFGDLWSRAVTDRPLPATLPRRCASCCGTRPAGSRRRSAPGNECFQGRVALSIEEWLKRRNL